MTGVPYAMLVFEPLFLLATTFPPLLPSSPPFFFLNRRKGDSLKGQDACFV